MKTFRTELDSHNFAGASEALTDERENRLRIALGKSWADVGRDRSLRLAISAVALDWPGDLDEAVDAVLDSLAFGGSR